MYAEIPLLARSEWYVLENHIESIHFHIVRLACSKHVAGMPQVEFGYPVGVCMRRSPSSLGVTAGMPQITFGYPVGVRMQRYPSWLGVPGM